jgi:transforming growth factor-beta-induced protein
MREIIHYHILPTTIRFERFYEGQLLDTKLVEGFLDERQQKIRIQKRFGMVMINHFVGIVEGDLEAENGIVHVLERVLLPPAPISHNLSMLPFIFSTTLSAIQSVNMYDAYTSDKSITCFFPSNHAWLDLNPVDLTYLFTSPGSVDLEKIIKYHTCKTILYTPDLVSANKELETYHEGQTIKVTATARKLIQSGESNPERWVISINDGEATIRGRGADYLGRNGNVYVVSNVLVPAGVVLPSMKSTMEDDGMGRRRRRFGWD